MSNEPRDKFQYVDPRMDVLMAGYDGVIPQEDFVQERIVGLSKIEMDIVHAFQARKELVQRFRKDEGKENFKSKWSLLTQESPKSASAALSIAAYATAQHIEKLYGFDNLLCAVEFGARTEEKKVKWPIFPVLTPELSAWLLSPVEDRNAQLFEVVDEICPDINSGDEDTSLNIFWEHTKLLCRGEEQSLFIYIKGKQVRSELPVIASFRMYTLSKFLSVVYDQVMNEKKCQSCSKSTENMKTCARCHCVHYCSRICQEKHFSKHKKNCKAILKELYERYSSDSIKTDFMSFRMSTET